MEITLTAPTPFSLPAVVNSHGWVQLVPFQRHDDGTFGYVARLANGRVLAYRAAPMAGGLTVSTSARLNEVEKAELAEQVRWTVGLDQDLSPFYELAREHPRLGHVPTHYRGRLLRSPTLFEDVVKTILTTNTTWSGTIRMVTNLVGQWGDSLPGDAGRHAFPTPEQLAAASADVLRREAGLGYRAPYIRELAQAVASTELALEALKYSKLPTPDLRRELLNIKGVGNYAAANLLLILGRYDHIPIDSWALRMVSQEWHDGESIGPAEVEAAFAEWGHWKGLAYWFWDWTH
ncbi:MAG TPA: hypothetical protein VE553_09855 [Candidatus Binatia bacterium]|nr:hypothetical protein [Candidatus Binatia bacterium]